MRLRRDRRRRRSSIVRPRRVWNHRKGSMTDSGTVLSANLLVISAKETLVGDESRPEAVRRLDPFIKVLASLANLGYMILLLLLLLLIGPTRVCRLELPLKRGPVHLQTFAMGRRQIGRRRQVGIPQAAAVRSMQTTRWSCQSIISPIERPRSQSLSPIAKLTSATAPQSRPFA